MKLAWLFLTVTFFVNTFLVTSGQTRKNLFEQGEELTYIVKYALIELGEIKIKVIEQREENGDIYYRTSADIQSYTGIPFLNLHQIFESKYNQNDYSDYFRAIDIREDDLFFTEYDFNNKQNKVEIKKGRINPYEVFVDSTKLVETKLHDGLSLFYYARKYAGNELNVSLDSFINEKTGKTEIQFTKDTSGVSISAFDKEIECVRLNGNINFIGIFGLTGEFEGWFTNDHHAVPVFAGLNVLIGKITIELKEWRKKNWTPPIYNP